MRNTANQLLRQQLLNPSHYVDGLRIRDSELQYTSLISLLDNTFPLHELSQCSIYFNNSSSPSEDAHRDDTHRANCLAKITWSMASFGYKVRLSLPALSDIK